MNVNNESYAINLLESLRFSDDRADPKQMIIEIKTYGARDRWLVLFRLQTERWPTKLQWSFVLLNLRDTLFGIAEDFFK